MDLLHQKGLGGCHRYLLPSQEGGGGNPRFSNPFYDFGFLNKFLHPGRVMVGKKLFFVPEGAKGMTEVSPTKMVGQSKVLKPLL